MARYLVRKNKYLMERTRRRLVGGIFRIGTGGSVPKPLQEIQDHMADERGGPMRSTMLDEMRGIFKQYADHLVVWTSDSPMFKFAKDASQLRKAIAGSQWKVPDDVLAQTFPEFFARESGEEKKRTSKKKV